MPGWRFTANGGADGPPSAQAALLPLPTYGVQVWQSRGPVHGSPGTEAIPAPYPPALDIDSPSAMANYGRTSNPNLHPVIFPPLYYQTDTVAAPLERSPVDYLNSDHQLPVPAIQAPNVVVARGVNTPGGINQYSPGAWLARLGGQSPIAWPRNVTTYSGPGS